MTGSDPALSLVRPTVAVSVPEALAVTPVPVPVVTGWRGKRLADVVLSVLLIVVLSPLLLLVAVAVKISSPGPVLFRQRRVGRGGKDFLLLKFRTMHTGAEQRLRFDHRLRHLYAINDHKVPNALDTRVTRIGRFLRKSSLDELPQLFNVLVGHMSLVGPRPVQRDELSCYRHRESVYLGVRPGLTGLWQVNGRNLVRFPQRADLDEMYVTHCSLLLDLAILARTPAAVVSCRGVI